MPLEARLSPRSGVRRRKDGTERAVWPSRRPLRPARIRPNPLNPGQMARFPSKTALQSAVKAVRRPSPLPTPLRENRPTGRPSNTPDNGPPLDEDPLEPLDFNTVTRPPAPLWTSAPLQGDRHAPESVIGMAELVVGIGGIRNLLAVDFKKLFQGERLGLGLGLAVGARGPRSQRQPRPPASWPATSRGA